MTAQILDGKKLASALRQELKEKVARLPAAPRLDVIIAGNNPASEIYVRNKEKACTETGIAVQTHKFPETVAPNDLAKLIDNLNNNPETNGILVQLPLPSHLDEKSILQTIAPSKDVDGFHPLNSGLMMQKQNSAFIPCTPKGIIRLLRQTRKDLAGQHAVVVGRSQIVGLPTAHLLLNENCTVTVAHSKTKNLAALCRSADILITAIGKPEFITGDFIKPGAIVIDVGINRTSDGLKGDVNFAETLQLAAYITPVPGGVGPMTIAMLLENTYDAFLKQRRP